MPVQIFHNAYAQIGITVKPVHVCLSMPYDRDIDLDTLLTATAGS
jgi:hypothetical protein